MTGSAISGISNFQAPGPFSQNGVYSASMLNPQHQSPEETPEAPVAPCTAATPHSRLSHAQLLPPVAHDAGDSLATESDLPHSLYSDKIAAISLLEGVSLFELMGVTWMMALTYENWSAETHTHAYDEVRHTKMIQDCARAARWTLSDAELIKETKLSREFYKATEAYLQKLAKRVFRLTFHQRTCDTAFAISSYALLAFLIERRIMRIYPNLTKFGATEEMRALAKEIVCDEREHLTLVTGKLPAGLDFADSSQDRIILMEKQLAAEWIGNLKAAYSRILG